MAPKATFLSRFPPAALSFYNKQPCQFPHLALSLPVFYGASCEWPWPKMTKNLAFSGAGCVLDNIASGPAHHYQGTGPALTQNTCAHAIAESGVGERPG
eukprot:1160894-Pelagomonas_calceolata.AAC.10